jgi:hypothetical protein
LEGIAAIERKRQWLSDVEPIFGDTRSLWETQDLTLTR